jgi:hypothetical protein
MKLIGGLLFAFCVMLGVLGFSPQGRGVLQAGSDAMAQAGAGYFDKRPVRTILIIGNSRTYFHQMPETVRRMAESAHSPGAAPRSRRTGTTPTSSGFCVSIGI